jgi:hypothetical protein
MLELAVWYCLGTLLTIIPVQVGVSMAPVNRSIQRSGISIHSVSTNPIGNANKNAKNPKNAQSLMAFSKFSPL